MIMRGEEMNNYEVPETAYIHGNELSQFIHIQVPMNLVIEECFSKISGNAKILYGLLLNRTGLSVRNGWQDEKGRTYIHYTIEEVMAELHVSYSTALRMFSELTNIEVIGTNESGKKIWFGLVEKVRVLNKPSRIYVHKVEEVIRIISQFRDNPDQTFGHNVQKFEDEGPENDANTGHIKNDMTVISNLIRPSYQICDDGDIKNDTTVISDMNPRSYQNCNENNNYINNNNKSNNYLINHIKDETEDGMDEDASSRMSLTRELIRDNVEYETLVTDRRVNKDMLDELIELMVETCVLSGDMRIGGKVVPHSLIQSRFEKYDMYTMEYVLGSLSENKTDVKNVKQYLIAVLYNAPVTRENHMNLRVQHDMSEWKK